MREPAVRCGAVPVFDLGRNVYNIAGDEQLRGLARFLIVASSCHADKNLPAAGFRVVDVPVVAAVNWTTPSQSLIVTGFNGIHVCVLCDPFMTSSFCQVISLLRPHSKPLLQD